ncbi:MAG: helix-turn-helix domain-containing protein [Armatimonadota bacterium]|nr:helix-turn-helix domain-containing protein [Armatimonadota bacterium]MDR7533216.1 helix-turn-helix domain-containing protein [Armatimonadota bacterium]MDR7535396.1 helix-turn-helix domain-containing protein [Armatimonadota bacterium]
MPRLTATGRAALSEERRRQILDAAARVFAARGYAAATIEAIARDAGVAEGTIYNYFHSKEELLIGIPRHLAGAVLDDLATRLPEAHDAVAAERVLTRAGRVILDRVRAHVRFLKVFFSALPYLSPRAREAYMRLMPTAVAGLLEPHLRAGQARGLYRAGFSPAIAARAFPAMLGMLALSEVLLGRRLLPHDDSLLAREVARLFLYGVLAPQRRLAGGVTTSGRRSRR